MSLSSSPGHLGLWFLVLSLVTMIALGVRVIDDVDYQKAKYHLTELKKILQPEMMHSIKRRSVTERSKDLEHALDSVCSIWYSEKEDRMTQDSKYRTPDIFPVKVKAEREGDKVKVTFDVTHTSQGSVTRIHSFDNASIAIEAPESNGQPTTSQVQLFPDTSLCGQDYNRAMYFFSQQENTRYFISAEVNVCGFDSNMDGKNVLERMRKRRVFSQVLPTPRFQVLSDPGDEDIIVERGDNTTLQVEVTLDKDTSFIINSILWDWESNTFLNDVARVTVSSANGKLVVDDQNYIVTKRETQLLKVEILSEAVSDKTSNSDKDDDGNSDDEKEEEFPTVDGVIGITVVTGSGVRSGNLLLSYEWRESSYDENQIVKSIISERMISLRMLSKKSAFPRNTIQFMEQDQSLDCTWYGNRMRSKNGKNCTIDCFVQGTDIKSISIIKSHPYRPPVKSSSFFLEILAGAMLDVGPASPDIEGTYTCVVITEDGTRKSKEFNLRTTGFTKITNFTLDDMGNSTTRVTCSVYGAQPLNVSITVNDGLSSLSMFSTEYRGFNEGSLDNVSITVSDDLDLASLSMFSSDDLSNNEERLDNKTENVLFLKSSDDETTLTLYVSTDQIQYPRENLECKSEGKRESAFSTINLPANIENYNPYIPTFKKEKSHVRKKKDGTTVIICRATGGEISDMMVSTDFGNRENRVDKKPGNRRRLVKRGDITTIKLIVPKYYQRWQRVYCGAENEFGENWIDLNK